MEKTRGQILKKCGGFSVFTPRDLEKIFLMYDNLVFNGEIKKKIENDGYTLEFKMGDRRSGIGSVTGFGNHIFYIDISPLVLEKASRFSSKTPLECLLLIMEHEIIHLIMMVWGYSNEGPSPRKGDIYSSHGRLFVCLAQRFFGGWPTLDHDMGVLDISKTPSDLVRQPGKKGIKILTGYQNWSASCYLDAVLAILFNSDTDFWKDEIFDDRVPAGMSEKDRKLALQVKDQLIEDYHSINEEGHTIMCSGLRHLLLKKAPDMKDNKRWIFYNAGAVYSVLANILPNFLMDVPSQIYRWKGKKYVADSVKYSKEAMFTMWDYMDPLTNIEKGNDYKAIRWDLLQSPVIVFTNGGTPRIKKFREVGIEKGKVNIEGYIEKFKVTKARAFDEKIIEGRYELIGVVVLEGVSHSGEGGGHYISYFKDNRGRWVFYDDIGPEIKTVNKLPTTGVWEERKGSMPSMYFYKKISRDVPTAPKSEVSPKSEDSPKDRSADTPAAAKPKIIDTKKIQYKRIDRPDNHSIIYIKSKGSKTPDFFYNLLNVGVFKEGSITRTVLQPDVITWRIPTSIMSQIEKKILSY